ncbi:MAG: hypothetical protein GX344_09095, partial [Intrasporangiaceae bacterium]|nr:hypothetical protein [Intrasporangiaceae bacterium]
MLTTHLRRVGAALAAAAIGLPALAITTASAEPVLDPPLTAAAGTSWTDGPCEVGAGVTVVVDMQGDAEAGVHCVTNEDGTAYSSPNALQTFADAGFAVETETTTYGPMICKVEGAPDPCGQWPGAWWGFYTADADAAWTMAGAGAHDTAAATDTFVGLSLVPEDSAGIEPRADTALLEDETPGDDEPAEERGDDEPADADAAVVAAADFLSRELQAQDHLFVNHGFNDYGLTADFALALAATGLNSEDAASAGQQVTANILEYIGTDGERYAGATAKSAVLALSLGMDSTDFGGVDLIAALQDLETESGRFSDVSEWGDYSNTLGQSLAIIALEGAGVGASQSAVDYLLDAQCDDGGFALTPTDGTCLSDPDATSFALQALLATPCATDASIDDALGYLVGRQQESGGLG